MKKSFLLLLLGMVVILTSMSDCTKMEEYSTVSAKLNGKLYESTEVYTYHASTSYPNHDPSIYIETSDTHFKLRILREIFSDDGSSCMISITVYGKTPIELNKEYQISDIESENNAIVTSFRDMIYSFDSTEGHLIFSQNNSSELSGSFEFTSIDDRIDSTLLVTEGNFRRLFNNL